ncbi:MAG TPA: methylenetetrahydrofolate reductase C-terminal domain-containing protein [Smithellaceae bacterium]|jgi:methylenetetrahydrofolate reductase (NADPH)|nr:methylenetetrahydrofolate reductase C-terminal domain-containing protein [Smithellaceae bacterium]HNT90726.1 methylenetetrahydrofolate reductase C-terminal domain-containing protein [Smithellaceae bacterium]HNV64555.1 methylenetetrahydrofolate reductase C-terminal domain-containing protein [Smithellaceae bacterium]HNZ30477.1 methylenetetrahydrofolate reductase C-terminal domain-containing protein [Smithellaceae bacterium]HOD30305.1 methylenetetrahydrofolate reductase C-terminal domain-contai
MHNNPFNKALLDPQMFAVSWELVPGRGAKEAAQERALALAQRAAAGGKIHAVSLTDNPGGTPAMSADFMGTEIKKMGIEPLVHLTCKDKNRSSIESQLYALDRAGVRNLLVMTGDYPVSGYMGRPSPVFDLDPIHVLQLISEMNKGLEYPGPKGIIRQQKCDFFAGAVVSPFKATEAEQMAQYYKLKKKIEAGAQFIVTQLGYDARKIHETFLFMKQSGFNVPIVGNIYILPYGAANKMNRNGLPGNVVTDKLLADIDQERNNSDKGVQARILRAARMYAIIKGIGFNGVHIGGHNIKYEQVEEIIRQGEALAPQWTELIKYFDYPMKNGFYYFEFDPKTGLNKEKPIDPQTVETAGKPEIFYGISRFFHMLMFEPGKKLYGIMKAISGKIAGSKLENIFHKLEYLTKVLIFNCRDCGDCALIDVAYLCPMSQCPKNQRNGACGGSYQGWCEVYPFKKQCIYVRAYARLKKYAQEKQLEQNIVPPCNWDLHQSSSWLNFYLGKDHNAKKQDNSPAGK